MTLQNAITEFANVHINGTNNWYSWQMNEEKLPTGIMLAQGSNAYSMNRELKNKLNEAWQNADDAKKRELTLYYIYHWGGIKKMGKLQLTSMLLQLQKFLLLEEHKESPHGQKHCMCEMQTTMQFLMHEFLLL